MKHNAVVIAGYYGFGNAGDELILRSLVDQFRHEDPARQVIVLSREPEHTSRQFNVQAVNRWNPLSWVPPLVRADRFILGGGGLLQESTGPWNYLYYLSLVVLAKVFGCRTEARAIGVDAVYSGLNRWFTRFTFNHFVDIISVRDTDSQRALESVGVYHPIFQTPDLVFQFVIPAPAPASSGKMAWAIAPWEQRLGWDHDLALLADSAKQELNVQTELLVFFPAQDTELAQKVADLSKSGVTIRQWQRPEDLLSWMQEYELIVGMRYHALVLAALSERPFIGWGYQRKVASLCRDFGQPVWGFERGWDNYTVLRQLADAWKRRQTLPPRYHEQQQRVKSPSPRLHDLPRIFTAHV